MQQEMIYAFHNEAIDSVRAGAVKMNIDISHVSDETILEWLDFSSKYAGQDDGNGGVTTAPNILAGLIYTNRRRE